MTPSSGTWGQRGHGIHRDALGKTSNAQAIALMEDHKIRLSRLAKKMMDRQESLDVDDLIQVGWIGLIEASLQHDPEQIPDLWRYAYKRVRGAMADEIRDAREFPRSAWSERPAEFYDPELPKRPTEWSWPAMEEFHSWRDRRELVEPSERASWVTMMAPLGDRERYMLTLYFVYEVALHRIGDLFGIGESRMSHIVKASLKKLRSTMQ